MKESPLGQATVYVETYTPDLLYPIPRSLARDKIQLSSILPFSGVDIWTGYELSWIDKNGKPVISGAEFIFSCASENVVESKSFKLYLNSFNQSSFSDANEVQKILEKDLSEASGAHVEVRLFPISNFEKKGFFEFSGFLLDDLPVKIDTYEVDTGFLKTSSEYVEEGLYSHLLKSNCLATGQPDWGSLYISYAGKKIERESFLQYIISFRKHAGFAEHCVEQIYRDILLHCKPDRLSVYIRYTRRGGLDINPFRSNFEETPENIRLGRQ